MGQNVDPSLPYSLTPFLLRPAFSSWPEENFVRRLTLWAGHAIMLVLEYWAASLKKFWALDFLPRVRYI
jgi:hypothetical protein